LRCAPLPGAADKLGPRPAHTPRVLLKLDADLVVPGRSPAVVVVEDRELDPVFAHGNRPARKGNAKATDKGLVLALETAATRAGASTGCLRAESRPHHNREGERMTVPKPCLCVALAVVVLATAVLVGCVETDQPEGVVEVETGEPVVTEVVLTKELVDKWIACVEDKEIKDLVESLGGDEGGDDPASLKAALEGMAASAELDKAVKSHGFDSAQQWAGVSVKVMAGLFSAKMAEAKEQMAEMGDAPEVQTAKAEMEKQLTAFQETFGELTEDEQQVVNDALDKIEASM